MRCKLIVLLAVSIALLGGSPAAAEVVKRELMIGIRGSLGLPIGDYPITGRTWSYLKDDVRTGWALGASVDKMVSPSVSIGGGLDYNSQPMRSAELRQSLQQQGYNVDPQFSWKTLAFTGHVRYYLMPEAAINFFGQFGAGAYVNKFSTSYRVHGTNGMSQDVPRNQSRTDIGINAGPGMLVRLGPVTRLSLDAIFHNVFTKNQSTRYLNITAGIIFSIMPE
ncbi:MAG: outer membrane beta-barrel protein [candidate division Zixibacteria bacterium]|nr:outer membrane beta-barrel protein [candidate division Zixibacteria bacterium]